MRTNPKRMLITFGWIAAISATLVLNGPAARTARASDKQVTVSTRMTQDKVLKGSDGFVSMALTLTAAHAPEAAEGPKTPVDLVIVLDRSGSMQGDKIAAARSAVLRLIEQSTPGDRLALVTYACDVELVAPLTAMNAHGRQHLSKAARQVTASGFTNLGGGLRQGIDLLARSPGGGRQRTVILISDGLANRGITDPVVLNGMAAEATDFQFTVSTVGVGLDFNELLMTRIADHGAGRYYFLQDPLVFARVFEKELTNARHVAASEITLRIALTPGVRLTDAGGYPIRMENGEALIHPGNLIAGEQRTLFLTFQVPTERLHAIVLGSVRVGYIHAGGIGSVLEPPAATVVCVDNPGQVAASVDKEIWSAKVVREEYSRLKEQVADAVRSGDPQAAQQRIQSYEAKQRGINAEVGSAAVADHLDGDIRRLRQSVVETFAGPPAAVAEKQKQTSKSLQYESYQQRRGKQ
jgi:Ca-activated chloride channel homolog